MFVTFFISYIGSLYIFWFSSIYRYGESPGTSFFTCLWKTYPVFVLCFNCFPFEAVNQSFFINKNDIETRNLYDWEDIFNIQQSSKNNKDDIFCDAKEEIIDNFKTEKLSESEKKQIENFKDAINSTNSGEMIQEAYNDKIEGVTRQLRRMIVKHPLEWNSTIYNNLTEKDFRNHDNPITPDDLKQLQDLMEKLSVWNDIKSICLSIVFTVSCFFFSSILQFSVSTI